MILAMKWTLRSEVKYGDVFQLTGVFQLKGFNIPSKGASIARREARKESYRN